MESIQQPQEISKYDLLKRKGLQFEGLNQKFQQAKLKGEEGLKATALLVLELGSVMRQENGYEDCNLEMFPELTKILSLKEQCQISDDQLREYHFGGNETQNAREKANVEQFLQQCKSVKFEQDGSQTREKVWIKNNYNYRQPLTLAWGKEIEMLMQSFREKLLKHLEALSQSQGITPVVDNFFEKFLLGENQFLPDGISEQLRNLPKALKGKILSTATLPSLLAMGVLNLKEGEREEDINFDEHKSTKKIQPAIDIIKNNKKTEVFEFVQSWIQENASEVIDTERMQKVQKIIDIITEGNHQFSEKTLEWLLLYGLEATREEPTKEAFSFNFSLGGDQVPPPYIEAYVLEPLQKMKALKALQDAGEITFMPTLDIVATAMSQLVENTKDHDGNPIERGKHIYNSLISLRRVQGFVEKHYPELTDHVNIHLFPEYQEDGLFRLYLAELTKGISISEEEFNKLFAIKGHVQDEINGDEQTLIEKLYGDINIYPARHFISNGNASDVHTLRFGADRTEPPFHFIACEVYKSMKNNHVVERLSQRIESSDLGQDIKIKLLGQMENLKAVVECHKQNGALHAQIGMKGVHATYYKQPQDPSMDEITQNKKYAPNLKEEDRLEKGPELIKVFESVIEVIGMEYYNHIAHWKDRYATENPGDICAYEAAEEMGLHLVSQQNTREYLKMHLQ